MTISEDVTARLGRELTENESARVPGLLVEASALVAGYLDSAYDADDAAVVVVESRVVARALTTATAAGVSSWQQTAGQVSHQQTMTPEAASSGGVWLSATDKQMLSGLRSSMTSTLLVSERYL